MKSICVRAMDLMFLVAKEARPDVVFAMNESDAKQITRDVHEVIDQLGKPKWRFGEEPVPQKLLGKNVVIDDRIPSGTVEVRIVSKGEE